MILDWDAELKFRIIYLILGGRGFNAGLFAIFARFCDLVRIRILLFVFDFVQKSFFSFFFFFLNIILIINIIENENLLIFLIFGY